MSWNKAEQQLEKKTVAATAPYEPSEINTPSPQTPKAWMQISRSLLCTDDGSVGGFEALSSGAIFPSLLMHFIHIALAVMTYS